VFQVDALIHEYWMRRFQDGALFHDPLTRVLVHSGYVPVGVQALYYGFSWVVDPVRLGAVGAVVVAPVSAWLLFRIVREHTEWRPAGWLGAALFLLPWNVQQFNGMHARAFGEPVVLLTLYLLLRRRLGWAALMPPVGMLLYPPAAAISLIMVIVAAVRSLVDNRRYPARRMALAVGSAAATAFAALAPTLANIQHSDLISESGPPLRRVQRPRTDALLQPVDDRDAEGAVLGVRPGHVGRRAAGRVHRSTAGSGKRAQGSDRGVGTGRRLPRHVRRQLRDSL